VELEEVPHPLDFFSTDLEESLEDHPLDLLLLSDDPPLKLLEFLLLLPHPLELDDEDGAGAFGDEDLLLPHPLLPELLVLEELERLELPLLKLRLELEPLLRLELELEPFPRLLNGRAIRGSVAIAIPKTVIINRFLNFIIILHTVFYFRRQPLYGEFSTKSTAFFVTSEFFAVPLVSLPRRTYAAS
jgi:hypothetical protein